MNVVKFSFVMCELSTNFITKIELLLEAFSLSSAGRKRGNVDNLTIKMSA